MSQGCLCSVASQWLCRDINLPSAGMYELIRQPTTSLKLGFDRSICLEFGSESRSMGMVKAAIICDVSMLSLFCSLTMVMQIY